MRFVLNRLLAIALGLMGLDAYSQGCTLSQQYAMNGPSNMIPGPQYLEGLSPSTVANCQAYYASCAFTFRIAEDPPTPASEWIDRRCNSANYPGPGPKSGLLHCEVGDLYDDTFPSTVGPGFSFVESHVNSAVPEQDFGGFSTCFAVSGISFPGPSITSSSEPIPSCSSTRGSTIDCRNQSLLQRIQLAGTDLELIYNSRIQIEELAPPRSISVKVPTWSHPFQDGNQWKLKKAKVTVSVAGKTYTDEILADDFYQAWDTSFTWDGLDQNGNPVTGVSRATIKTAYIFEEGWNPSGGEEELYRIDYLTMGAPAASSHRFAGAWSISDFHRFEPQTNIIYKGDGGRIKIKNKQVEGFPYSLNSSSQYVIPSEDASLLYTFDSTGQHLSTKDAITGVTLLTFQYTSNRLTSITDRDGLVTTIQRNGSGEITDIVGPYGVTSQLTYDGNGYLASVEDPLGNIQSFTYYSGTAAGLMSSMTDARNKTKNYYYDSAGRLEQATDRNSGSKYFVHSTSSSGNSFYDTVTMTTPMGRTVEYKTTFEPGYGPSLRDTFQSGYYSESKSSDDGLVLENSDTAGLSTRVTMAAHSKYADRLIPIKFEDLSTGGGAIDTSRTFTYDSLNPLQVATYLKTDTLGTGKTYTTTYTKSTDTISSTSPLGIEVEETLDAKGRVVSSQLGSLLPVEYTYNSSGQLIEVEQGTRSHTFTYNNKGLLETATNPLSQTLSYTYDAAGQLKVVTLPNTKTYEYSYNENGDLSELVNAAAGEHSYSFDDNQNVIVNTEPLVGSTTFSWGFDYNADDQRIAVAQADSTDIDFYHNSAGQLTSVVGPTTTRSYTYTYDANLESITSPGSNVLTFQGVPVPSQVSWSGDVNGSVSYSWDSFKKLSGFTVNGSASASFQYDNDENLIDANGMSLAYSNATGLLTSTDIDVVETTQGHNTYGEVTGFDVTNNGSPLIEFDYQRDALGRISQISKTTSSGTVTTDYTYSSVGHLSSETTGSVTKSYTYTDNGNRLTSSGSETYDSHDRLISDSSWTYTYNKNGHLTRKDHVSNGSYVNYDYDEFGNLLEIEESGGLTVEYLADGMNRRIQRKLNGNFSYSFLYLDQLKPAAQLDSNGAVESIFIYGSRPNVPEIVVKNGINYRIIHDHIGSPIFVIRSDNGQLVQEMTYDSWGNVLADTNPGFQPFGFAGGLYDSATKLLRFGSRDYDPSIGRWLNKDAIRHDGGMNLFSYSGNDPINNIDPSGLDFRVCSRPLDTGLGIAIGPFRHDFIVFDSGHIISWGASDEGFFNVPGEFIKEKPNKKTSVVFPILPMTNKRRG